MRSKLVIRARLLISLNKRKHANSSKRSCATEAPALHSGPKVANQSVTQTRKRITSEVAQMGEYGFIRTFFVARNVGVQDSQMLFTVVLDAIEGIDHLEEPAQHAQVRNGLG